jgi:Kdo2-lipid IVA lauroyltransferase/acyltransferase
MTQPPTRRLKYFAADLFATGVLASFLFLFRFMPPWAMNLLARLLATAIHGLIPKYRKRVNENLSLAFGEAESAAERRALVREIFFHLALTPLESIYAYAKPADRYILKIPIQGKEHLDKALAGGRGVVALGAHLGPFTLIGLRLALEGYRYNVIINQDNFPRLMRLVDSRQHRTGQHPFPPKPPSAAIKRSLNCLRRNEILYIVADEQQRRGGLAVPFFGQPALTPVGPALFSLKTGAPLLPMFLIRRDGSPPELQIGPPVEIERSGNEARDLETLTARFTTAVEEKIRQVPGQWTWLNRRWKPARRGKAS